MAQDDLDDDLIDGDGSGSDFESKLGQGRERFLAHLIAHALDLGRRTPQQFIEHFPPAAIMQGLRDRPTLRANILVITTGIRTKIALKKSAASAGEDLQIALDEGEADAETIVTLLDPDDRVRYLDAKKLWRFITEGDFWNAGAGDKQAFEQAKEHIAYMLDRALKDELVSHRDIIEGITIHKLAELLPRAELEKIITGALTAAHGGKPFTEGDLISAIPTMTIVKHVALPLIWERVVVGKIAEAHGYADRSGAPREAASQPDVPPTAAAEAPAVASVSGLFGGADHGAKENTDGGLAAK